MCALVNAALFKRLDTKLFAKLKAAAHNVGQPVPRLKAKVGCAFLMPDQQMVGIGIIDAHGSAVFGYVRGFFIQISNILPLLFFLRVQKIIKIGKVAKV